MIAAPRVTVLIGCWNNAGTLQRAIDSILAQTIDELELIVVDDGSTDHSLEVVEACEDSRVRSLALDHLGIAASLNRGMDAARAAIVAFQDADDWSLPRRLERQLAVLDERSEVAVVGCWMDEVDVTGAVLRPRQPRRAGMVGDVLEQFNPIPGTCAMLRRSAAREAGDFDPRFLFAADYDLWSRISRRHQILCLGEVLAVRQMSTGQAGSRHERRQIREGLRVRADLIRRTRRYRSLLRLARPAASLVAPPGLKRAIRRRRRMAP